MMDRELNYKIIKRGIIVLILLFILPHVFATEQEIFSGRIFVNEPADVDGKTLSVAPAGDVVSVDYDGATIFVEEGECETDIFLKVCVTSVEGSFAADISVYLITTDVEIKKTTRGGKEEFTVGQIIYIKMNVTNLGNRPIDYLKIEEDLSDFEILKIDGCDLNGTSISMEVSLGPRNMINCEYELLAIKAGKFKPETIVSYFDGYRNQTKEEKLKIEITEYGLELNADVEDSYSLGERTKLTFEIINHFPYNVRINELSIKTKGLSVSSSSLRPRMLYWKGYIEKDTEFNYTLDLDILNVSNEITTFLDYIIAGERQTQISTLTLPVEYEPPRIIVRDITNTSIKIKIRNPNDNFTYNNLNLTMRSVFNNIEKRELIISLKSKEEIDIFIETPVDRNVNLSVPILFSGQFFTDYGEPLSFSSADYIRTGSSPRIERASNLSEAANITNQTTSNTFSFIKENKTILILIVAVIIIILAALTIYFIKFKRSEKNPK